MKEKIQSSSSMYLLYQDYDTWFLICMVIFSYFKKFLIILLKKTIYQFANLEPFVEDELNWPVHLAYIVPYIILLLTVWWPSCWILHPLIRLKIKRVIITLKFSLFPVLPPRQKVPWSIVRDLPFLSGNDIFYYSRPVH